MNPRVPQKYTPFSCLADDEALFNWPMTRWPISMMNNIPSSHLNVYENDENVIVEAPLPGFSARDKDKNIDITFERGVLSIHANKKESAEDKSKKFYHRCSASFNYDLAVPGNIDERTQPRAQLKDGMMKVLFKKQKKAQPKRINVEAAG